MKGTPALANMGTWRLEHSGRKITLIASLIPIRNETPQSAQVTVKYKNVENRNNQKAASKQTMNATPRSANNGARKFVPSHGKHVKIMSCASLPYVRVLHKGVSTQQTQTEKFAILDGQWTAKQK